MMAVNAISIQLMLSHSETCITSPILRAIGLLNSLSTGESEQIANINPNQYIQNHFEASDGMARGSGISNNQAPRLSLRENQRVLQNANRANLDLVVKPCQSVIVKAKTRYETVIFSLPETPVILCGQKSLFTLNFATRIMNATNKRRPQMRQVSVQSIEQVTPRMRRIILGGESLQGFPIPRPGAHIKLFFGENLGDSKDPKKMRSHMRTYTPRQFNPDINELTIEFVLHGTGLASTWAAQAQVGDDLIIAGPGGGMDIPETSDTMVMLVDESALPATGMVLEALPSNCTPIVIAEVENAHEQRSLSSQLEVRPIWLNRQEEEASPGLLLEQYLPKLKTMAETSDNIFWWIACEANAMRHIRSQLLQWGIPKEQLVSRGYWKAGASNHPDHDYGES